MLASNRIQRVGSRDLEGCSGLQRLDLSSNVLKILETGSLYPCTDLSDLYLNGNYLVYSKLPSDLFGSAASSLKILHLHNNSYQAGHDYNDRLFSKLVHLQELAIDSIPNATFAGGFTKLHSLQTFEVDGCVSTVKK